jgi:hypothetical protein
MNLNQLTKKEKISVVAITIWTFISLTNYLSKDGWCRDGEYYFVTPVGNILDFFSNLFSHQSNCGYDNKELMIYVILPWLIFFIYFFLLRKDKEQNDQASN